MRILTVFACALLLCSPSHAQTSPDRSAATPAVRQQQAALIPPAAKSDPVKEADVRQLLKVTGTEALIRQTLDSMEKSMRPLMLKALPPGAYRERLVALFLQKFNSLAKPQDVEELAIPVYERNFTDEDIKGLIRFYQSPLGQKAVKTLPKIMAEIRALARKWGEKQGRESMKEVLSEHPDLAKEAQAAAHQQRH